MMDCEPRVEIFSSFEDENAAERRRQAAMSPPQRLAELAMLQERLWGAAWTATPLVRRATWEWVSW